MTIATGTVLVLVTWSLSALILITAGLLPAWAIAPATSKLHVFRVSLWWGLLVVAIFALAVSLTFPLSSSQVGLAGLLVIAALGIPGWLVFRRGALRWQAERPRGASLLIVVAALATAAYFAVAALGPVTNYDSGLYHLGAIHYAADYAAIPGLANLYFPFGYGTAQFPLAAVLTNGPWGPEGYRLLNGLVLFLATLDVTLRTLTRRRGPGFYVLAGGLVATWVPMVALSDYWVTSPSQDSAALVLTVVASAYLTDAVHGRKAWLGAASTAVAIATILTLIRPTMGAYLLGTLVVLLALAWFRKPRLRKLAVPAALPMALGLLALAVTTARDRILSGWAQYPLTAFPFDVPWRAVDPSPYRTATLGYHRNPEDLWNSTDGWDWIGPWLGDRVHQWETYELLALIVFAVILVCLAMIRSQDSRLLARMALSGAPSFVAALVWFLVTPPSYRFAWGALFTLATVPIGWALWSLNRSSDRARQPSRVRAEALVALMALPVLAVTAYSALFRLDLSAMNERGTFDLGVAIPVSFAPVADVPVSDVGLSSGLALLKPIESDQCWVNYPLCTPNVNASLAPITKEWQDGFVTR